MKDLKSFDVINPNLSGMFSTLCLWVHLYNVNLVSRIKVTTARKAAVTQRQGYGHNMLSVFVICKLVCIEA